jgi:glycosyltransferase involved in cell wall biosynthesis
MKILFLAPHPFYQERGTPIAVDMLLQVMSEHGEEVDVLTYHEGEDVSYRNVSIHRIAAPSFVTDVRPGFSWKKLVCDLLLFVKALGLVSRKRYDLVYAVEESAFMALAVKFLCGTPYVYDMDSSIAMQMLEKYPALKLVSAPMQWAEGLNVRFARAVVPVCEALADITRKFRPEKLVILNDVPLEPSSDSSTESDLRSELDLDGQIVLYVGNLEFYQGVDLLLDSFLETLKRTPNADLVIVGGVEEDVVKYRRKSQEMMIDHKVHLVGSRPVSDLPSYLSQADILVSPRISGNNTPMKLYSYLGSGKPVVATNLFTHTQVVDKQAAMLPEPNPQDFGEALCELIENAQLRASVGAAGKDLIERKYTFKVYKQKLESLLDWLGARAEKPSLEVVEQLPEVERVVELDV